MGIKFNPLTFSGFNVTGASGGSTTIGGAVVGSTPFGILSVDGANSLTQLGPLTNGQILIGSTGASAVAATITGTASQISVANGPGSITLSLSQNISAASSPTFTNLTLSGLTPSQPVKTNGANVLISALIVNSDIGAGAAISLSKLAALGANRALQSDGSGVISASSVTSTELGYVSGVTSSIQTQLNSKLNLSGGTMSGSINMGNNSITNLLDPVSAQDAATKNYVDLISQGISWKNPVRAVSTSNIILSGTQTVDGVALIAGDRVLVNGQTISSQNGIYVVSAGAWSRSADAVTGPELVGAAVFVTEGTVNGSSAFVQQTPAPITIGVTSISFAKFASATPYTFRNGLLQTGQNVDVVPGDNSLTATPGSLTVKEDPAGAIVTGASGIKVNVDNSTIDINGSNQIEVKSGGITNTQISASAAITYSKLTLTNSIVNADIAAAAAIARTKIASGTAFALVSNDGSGVLSSLGPLTNGQILIGSTGSAAVASTLTAGTGISVSNGAGTITISSAAVSTGDIPQTSFSGANNQVAPADVTAFLFSNASVRSFSALVSVSVNATTPLFEAYELLGIQKASSWEMAVESVGDTSQVVFTITNAGQIQYVSGNYPGFVSLTVKFRAIVTNTP